MLDYSTPASSFGDRARRSKSGYVFNLPSIINLLTFTDVVVYSFSYLTYYQTLTSDNQADCQEVITQQSRLRSLEAFRTCADLPSTLQVLRSPKRVIDCREDLLLT